MNLGISFTRYRGQEISSVITDSQGELKTTLQQYPAQLGTDVWVETAFDFHTLTYNTGELTDNEKELFNDIAFNIIDRYDDGEKHLFRLYESDTIKFEQMRVGTHWSSRSSYSCFKAQVSHNLQRFLIVIPVWIG